MNFKTVQEPKGENHWDVFRGLILNNLHFKIHL